MQGIIFDIQRFALHDGPGIRTTVFLKGCSLLCKWCCNPESQEMKEQLAYDTEKCKDSLECVPVCKPSAHSSLFGFHRFSRSTCTNCGDCANVCSNNALKFYGYRMTSDEILTEVLKDRNYFNNSNGGLTLSGGEPLHQNLFAKEILKKAKEKNIHTCIETSGFADRGKLESIAPYTDLFLYDYKITNEEQHLKYTGVSNKKIIENLALLAALQKEVILRCLLVPGVNDNEQHFKAIVNLSNKYANIIRVELMLYHDYGSHKYAPLDMEYWPDAPASSTPKEKGEEWLSEIKRLGGENIFIG
jgi:pyruvate formate lyase activating enzyme